MAKRKKVGTLAQEGDAASKSRVERAIRFISPGWALRRNTARRREELMHAFASYRHSEYNRLVRARQGKSGGADAHLDKIERGNLVERSRDVDRNNSVATGMFDRSVDNTIATGITPQARTGNEKLNEAQEEGFAEWSEGECDIRGVLSYPQMQRLTYRSIKRDGDIGFILTKGRKQPIEGDRLVTPHNAANKANIVQGVEMNDDGQPVAYWVADYAPYGGYVNEGEADRVPARNFQHIYDPKRFSQSRGCPALASCLGYFEQLDQYIEYELATAGAASMVGGVITGDERVDPFEPLADKEEDAAGDERSVFDLEPAAVLNLSGVVGGKYNQVVPSHPTTQFAEFVTEILRLIGLPLGLPIELIALDTKKGSYASSRLALLQAYRTFRWDQKLMILRQCRKDWKWKQMEFALSGKVKVPKGVKDADIYRHTWFAPQWEWIDPRAEAQAHSIALDRGMETLQDIAKERGYDATELILGREAEIKAAQESAERLGLTDAAGKPDWQKFLRAETKVGVVVGAGA